MANPQKAWMGQYLWVIIVYTVSKKNTHFILFDQSVNQHLEEVRTFYTLGAQTQRGPRVTWFNLLLETGSAMSSGLYPDCSWKPSTTSLSSLKQPLLECPVCGWSRTWWAMPAKKFWSCWVEGPAASQSLPILCSWFTLS